MLDAGLVRSLKADYDTISRRLAEALESFRDGDAAGATAVIESTLAGEYGSRFLPTIDRVNEEERLAAEEAVASAESMFRRARSTALVISMSATILALIISIVIIRTLAASIETLTRGAQAIGEGDTNARVTVRGGGEFAILGGAFNKMSANLGKSRQRLESANEDLKGYADVVSHDLKGPLANVSVAASMIQDAAGQPPGDERDADILEIAGTLKRSTDTAIHLVDDLLDLAEAGNIPERVSSVDVRRVVNEIVAESGAELEKRGASMEIGRYLGTVQASETHVRQLFSNLIRNALLHCDSAAPEITVTMTGRCGAGYSYLVKDNGSGIPVEHAGRLFVPFFKGPGGGTGMGLAIVKKIVNLYGGDIRAYNDDGACFEFTLNDIDAGLKP